MVGLYILNKISPIFGRENVGLYRDDGLAVLKKSGPETNRIKKELHEIFKGINLKITVETSLKATDFLDVTLDLKNNKYYPYRKPNNPPLYINANSNHPPNVIREIPKMIEKRLSDLSCNKAEFEKSKPIYEEALEKSGFNHTLKYAKTPPKKKVRKRNILWFNPPFCRSTVV